MTQVYGHSQQEGPGVAGYGVWFGPLHPLNISSPLPVPVQTNNRAELTARLEALRAVPLSQPLRIITDTPRGVPSGAAWPRGNGMLMIFSLTNALGTAAGGQLFLPLDVAVKTQEPSTMPASPQTHAGLPL